MQDRDEGFSVGPFYDEEEVSRCLGTKDWPATERFPVFQKDSVRGVDNSSTTGSEVNDTVEVREKLEVPSTDENLALLKALRLHIPDRAIAAWVLDERRAYRQIPIAPHHRRYSVVAVWNPVKKALGFFIS